MMRVILTPALVLAGCATAPAPGVPAIPARSQAQILSASPASDWRRLDPENTLYMEIPSGRVVLELAPHFAPRHVENIRKLVRQRYFDGLAIIRSQDNYVVQWGDDDEAADPRQAKDQGAAARSLEPEFTRAAAGLAFTALPDRDTYATEAGFSDGFAAARDGPSGQAWMVHCYGIVGVGRGNEVTSGNGSSLYAVIGSAPRLLDRNITLVGRVVEGIDKLSVLPRGTGALGFYEKAEQRVPIRQVRLAADVAPAERAELEALRTDSATFRELVQVRRFRRDDWYKVPAGHVDVCNVTLPVRRAAKP